MDIGLVLHILRLVIVDNLRNIPQLMLHILRQPNPPAPTPVPLPLPLLIPTNKLQMQHNIPNPILPLVVPTNERAHRIPQQRMQPTLRAWCWQWSKQEMGGFSRQGRQGVDMLL